MKPEHRCLHAQGYMAQGPRTTSLPPPSQAFPLPSRPHLCPPAAPPRALSSSLPGLILAPHLEALHAGLLALGALHPEHNLLGGLSLRVVHSCMHRGGVSDSATHSSSTTRRPSACMHLHGENARSSKAPGSTPCGPIGSSHLLVEDGLGLATVASLLTVVSPLPCGPKSATARSDRYRYSLSNRDQVDIPRTSRAAVAVGASFAARSSAVPAVGAQSPHAPWAKREAFPVLYWVTFIVMCFLQPLQKAFLVFGTFTWTPEKLRYQLAVIPDQAAFCSRAAGRRRLGPNLTILQAAVA